MKTRAILLTAFLLAGCSAQGPDGPKARSIAAKRGGVSVLSNGGYEASAYDVTTKQGTRCVFAISNNGSTALSCDWSQP